MSKISFSIYVRKILDNYNLNKQYKGVKTIQYLCSRVWNLIDELKIVKYEHLT